MHVAPRVNMEQGSSFRGSFSTTAEGQSPSDRIGGLGPSLSPKSPTAQSCPRVMSHRFGFLYWASSWHFIIVHRARRFGRTLDYGTVHDLAVSGMDDVLRGSAYSYKLQGSDFVDLWLSVRTYSVSKRPSQQGGHALRDEVLAFGHMYCFVEMKDSVSYFHNAGFWFSLLRDGQVRCSALGDGRFNSGHQCYSEHSWVRSIFADPVVGKVQWEIFVTFAVQVQCGQARHGSSWKKDDPLGCSSKGSVQPGLESRKKAMPRGKKGFRSGLSWTKLNRCKGRTSA